MDLIFERKNSKEIVLETLSGKKIDNQHVERIKGIETIFQKRSLDEAPLAIVETGLRKEKVIRCVAAPVLLQMKAMVFLSLLLTCLYNGKRGFIKTPFVKYCFYAFYPFHMLVIYLLAKFM